MNGSTSTEIIAFQGSQLLLFKTSWNRSLQTDLKWGTRTTKVERVWWSIWSRLLMNCFIAVILPSGVNFWTNWFILVLKHYLTMTQSWQWHQWQKMNDPFFTLVIIEWQNYAAIWNNTTDSKHFWMAELCHKTTNANKLGTVKRTPHNIIKMSISKQATTFCFGQRIRT